MNAGIKDKEAGVRERVRSLASSLIDELVSLRDGEETPASRVCLAVVNAKAGIEKLEDLGVWLTIVSGEDQHETGKPADVQ